MSSEHRARVRRSGGEEGLREAAVAEVREDVLEKESGMGSLRSEGRERSGDGRPSKRKDS